MGQIPFLSVSVGKCQFHHTHRNRLFPPINNNQNVQTKYSLPRTSAPLPPQVIDLPEIRLDASSLPHQFVFLTGKLLEAAPAQSLPSRSSSVNSSPPCSSEIFLCKAELLSLYICRKHVCSSFLESAQYTL